MIDFEEANARRSEANGTGIETSTDDYHLVRGLRDRSEDRRIEECCSRSEVGDPALRQHDRHGETDSFDERSLGVEVAAGQALPVEAGTHGGDHAGGD